MAKLGEVLGGVVRDVIEARAMADRMASESVRAYAEDPLLAAFPVPRVTFKDVTIKLRFAVDRVVERQIQRQTSAEAADLWKQTLAAKVLPAVLGSLVDAAVLKRATDAVAVAKTPDFQIAAALKGDAAAMAKASVAFVAGVISRLPADVRGKLTASNAAVKEAVPGAVPEFVKRARDLAAANAASRTELEVLVNKADLEKAPESGIHEFSFVLSMDDLQVVAPSASTPQTKPKP